MHKCGSVRHHVHRHPPSPLSLRCLLSLDRQSIDVAGDAGMMPPPGARRPAGDSLLVPFHVYAQHRFGDAVIPRRCSLTRNVVEHSWLKSRRPSELTSPALHDIAETNLYVHQNHKRKLQVIRCTVPVRAWLQRSIPVSRRFGIS